MKQNIMKHDLIVQSCPALSKIGQEQEDSQGEGDKQILLGMSNLISSLSDS